MTKFIDKLQELIRRKYDIDCETMWSKGLTIYLNEIYKELDEVKYETDHDNRAYFA